LLIGWYRLFVLDLLLDIFDRVRWLNVEHDQISGGFLDEDLHRYRFLCATAVT
jgi:hypothetical protein